MKFFNAIAAAAVIDTSLVSVHPAQAIQLRECAYLVQAEKNKCLRDLRKSGEVSD